MSKLIELLEYLEENLDGEHIKAVLERRKRSLEYKNVDRLPVIITYPLEKFNSYKYGETYENMEYMLYNELLGCVRSIEIKDDSLPMIRSNYGVGTLPAVFGLKCRIINDSMPWVDHLESEYEIKQLIDKGIPNFNNNMIKRITGTHEFYKETLSKYPKCNSLIKIYHPDFQGPFDVAHLIWGSDIYIAMYDSPQLVHELMELITNTYIQLMKKIKTQINDATENYVYHWGALYKGKIVLRNDSAVNLSKDMYLEFVRPYDEKILKAFDGGSMHFCGRADQWIFDMLETKNMLAINFGYMENVIFGEEYLNFLHDNKLNQLKIPIVSYYLTREQYNKLDKKHFNTGISLINYANSKEEAIKYLMEVNKSN